MLAKKIYVTAIAAALGATLAAPLAFPENFRSGQRTEAQDEIAKNLDQFESAAAALQRQADEYATSMRAHRPQRESHARQLTGVKEQVNYLGRQLSKLEELSPAGTSLQQRAIEVARPHLEAVAEDVQWRVGEIEHSLAVRRLDPRLPHVPLPRDRPVEDRGSGRHL